MLLILAGVTIAALSGPNGILTNATKAKEESSKSQVIDEARVDILAKQTEKKGASITAGELEEILTPKYGTLSDEENILDRTLTTKDGYQIPVRDIWNGTLGDNVENGNVKIIISKTPETELSGGVTLKVSKIEGLDGIDINNIDINELDEYGQKELAKKIDWFFSNAYYGTNYKDFEEFIKNEFDNNEQKYRNMVGEVKEYLENSIRILKAEGIENLYNCRITNPEDEMSYTYTAFENGEYTFKVEDLSTGKLYTEAINVNNIDTGLNFYYPASRNGDVYLLDKTKNYVDFDDAYIIFNEERINVNDCIITDNYKHFYVWGVSYFLFENGKIESTSNFEFSTQLFEIVKDGKSYFHYAQITRAPM